jgi:hypothetical protein
MLRPCTLRFKLATAAVALVSIFLGGLISRITPKVDAQAQTQLVPLVTDQTPLALSNQFGVAIQPVVNQSGDYAFLGRGSSALFFRPAGASVPERVFQMGDEVPGFPGSRADIIRPMRLNSSGLLAFQVDFFQSSGVGQGIIFTFDGTSLHRIVAGDDPAPGGGGANFERFISLVGLNDSGAVAFTATLVPSTSGLPPVATALYIVPSGGAPLRVAGLGDAAPGTLGGTYGSFTALGFNNLGEELFRSNITGGSGGQGLFVGNTSGVRKAVTSGDPNPSGGLFPNPGPTFLNNSGDVAFQIPGNVYINSPITGTSRVEGTSDVLPASIGGHLGGGSQLLAFGDGGDIAFTCNVIASAASNLGLFRVRAGNPIEVVAYRNQAAPGATGEIFSNSFTATSINSTGVVSFRGAMEGGSVGFGIFQQTGSNPPINIALDGEATTLTGGGSYSFANTFATRTLDNNSVYFGSEVPGGAADYAEFLISGGGTTILMNTADPLPAGGRVVFRTFRLGAAGNFVGFLAQHPGGRFSIAVHNIGTHATSILTTEGDTVPGTGGGRLTLGTVNTIFINSSGSVAFSAQLVGGTLNGNSAIFVGTPGGSLSKVVAGGEVDPATGRTFSALTLNTATPSAINEAEQVVFTTLLVSGTSSIRGVFVGSAGISPAKIAAVGDTMSDGRTIASFQGFNEFQIKSGGQVAFLANTTGGGSGIYVGIPGSTPSKVVATGDSGPGGSTFSALAKPGFNDSGEIAFVAALSGGTGGGVFLGSISTLPVPLALNGDSAPAGGNFSIDTARPDALINNQHDVVFRANLTGGTAGSGYFVRRGPLGTLQAPVLQGQPAPGTTGIFGTISPGLNGFVGENFELGPAGDLAFQNLFVAAGGNSGGIWHVKTDNTIEEILVRGIVAPEFGGGSAVESTASASWNSGGRFAVWARVSGGTFTDGIFLFVPTVSTNTPAGTVVPVTATDSTTGTTPVEMTFDSVTTAGNTTLTTSSGGPAIPTAFALGDPPVFYNLETTATFTGSIGVCIDFSSVSFPAGSNLRLLHFQGGAWVDVTTSGPTGNIICGNVTSLSPFTVVQQLDNTAPALTVTLTPNVIWPPNKQMVQVSASIEVSDNFDPSPRVELVSITSNEFLKPGDIEGATFNTDDRSFQLRATRAGGGSGRVYTITYRARDASGNTTVQSAQVVVPHDQGH